MPSDIHEAARQAAREAVARRLEADGWPERARVARLGGKYDKMGDVADAIAGALAAVPVVREMVRADVLRDVALRLPQEIAELPDRTSPEQWPEAMLVTADEIETIILALAEKDTGR